MDGSAGINWFDVFFGLTGGLAIFLFGMTQMTDALKAAAGEGLKSALAKLTPNRVTGALTGAAVTAVIQSSSVTTVLLVGFISAGLMTLQQSIGVILGANVGTTITAMLAALAVGEIHAVTVAFAHLLFNVCGILVIWPLPALRRLPIAMAERMTSIAMHSRIIPVAWVLMFFFALPFAAILLLR